MHRFLRQFFIAFPQLSKLDFYIAGESYGGSWVPALGAEIIQSQAKRSTLEKQSGSPFHFSQDDSKRAKIPLKGIMIGNGLVRQSVQNPGNFEAACSGPDSLFTHSQCLEWAPRAMWCETNLKVCEPDNWTSDACKNAEKLCSEMGGFVTGTLHRNPYDWRLTCDDPPNCYPQMQHIDEYLNRTDVKIALGVDETVAFNGVSYEVFEQWEKVGDLWKSSDSYVNYLLDSVSSPAPAT